MYMVYKDYISLFPTNHYAVNPKSRSSSTNERLPVLQLGNGPCTSQPFAAWRVRGT